MPLHLQHAPQRFQATGVSGGLKRYGSKRNQLSVGGRQMSGGLNEGEKKLPVNMGVVVTGSGWGDCKETSVKSCERVQSCPVLQGSPVRAAVSASLQQSAAALE